MQGRSCAGRNKLQYPPRITQSSPNARDHRPGLLHQPGAFHLEQWIEKPAAVKRRVRALGASYIAKPLNSLGPNVRIEDDDSGQESASSRQITADRASRGPSEAHGRASPPAGSSFWRTGFSCWLASPKFGYLWSANGPCLIVVIWQLRAFRPNASSSVHSNWRMLLLFSGCFRAGRWSNTWPQLSPGLTQMTALSNTFGLLPCPRHNVTRLGTGPSASQRSQTN